VAGEVARWLSAPPPAWDALWRDDPNGTAVHRPGFVAALAAILPGHEPGFVAVERGGELIGGAAAFVVGTGGPRSLQAMPFGLPGAPLARPGEHGVVDAAFARALAARAAELGAIGGAWIAYRPEGPPVASDALGLVPGETREIETTLLDLREGIDGVARRMDKKTRHEWRRSHERLDCVEDTGALDHAYGLHRSQSRAWPGHRPLPVTLARRLLDERDGAQPVARLFVVRDGRGPLSAGFVLDHPRECFVWWTGSHPDARRGHAVTRLFGGIAEWAADSGHARFNLGASPGLPGVAAFKRSLGGVPYPHPARVLAPGSGWARAMGALQSRMRGMIGRGRGA
jgi:hypothetical protein